MRAVWCQVWVASGARAAGHTLHKTFGDVARFIEEVQLLPPPQDRWGIPLAERFPDSDNVYLAVLDPDDPSELEELIALLGQQVGVWGSLRQRPAYPPDPYRKQKQMVDADDPLQLARQFAERDLRRAAIKAAIGLQESIDDDLLAALEARDTRGT